MSGNKKVEHVLTICKYCGNRGLLNIVAQYDQEVPDYCAGELVDVYEYKWRLLECPVCSGISLYQKIGGENMIDYKGDYYYQEKTIYPADKVYKNVPKDIMKSYLAAVKTAKVDYSISLIAIRAVLEKICKERGCSRGTLEEMLKNMVDNHIFPKTLDECGYIIRKMGNNGAHGEDDSMLRGYDIEELIDFVETIMYYIYELPVKVEELNNRYNLKLEEKRRKECEVESNE